MNVIVSLEDEEGYKKGVKLDLSRVNEEIVKMSLLGETGQPFKCLLIDYLRTKEHLKERQEINTKGV